MAGNLTRSATRNLILKQLSEADFARLEDHFEAVELPLRTMLEPRGKRVEHVYFLERGLASVVANGGGGAGIEVGVIGREGVTGISLVLGNRDRAANETYIQMEGHGQRMSADALHSAIEESRELHSKLLQYVHSFLLQTTRTALANGRSNIEERLARWLLMASDRGDGDDLHLTHEFLSTMLGVRRSGVTAAVQELERRSLIKAQRGVITILDRKALEKASKGAYLGPFAG